MESTILIAAKQEYTQQLHDILSDNLIISMKEIWESCKTSKQPLKTFQEKLCDIPEWNKQVLLRHYNNILEKQNISEEYLEKIIEAVFLSNIKILSVVKLESKKQTIDVKIPDTQNFIHKCLIQLARELYQDPHLIDDRENSFNSKIEIQRNYKRMLKLAKECIEKIIRNMTPMKDILDKYLESHDDKSLSSNENIEIDEPIDIPEEKPQEFSENNQVNNEVNHETPPSFSEESSYQEQQPVLNNDIKEVFMEQPKEEPIKVDLRDERYENFFSDEEDT